MSEPPRFEDDNQHDDNRGDRYSDGQFNAWLSKRQPKDEPSISASTAFLEMMRQAATDAQTRQQPNEPPPAVDEPPQAEPDAAAPPQAESTVPPEHARFQRPRFAARASAARAPVSQPPPQSETTDDTPVSNETSPPETDAENPAALISVAPIEPPERPPEPPPVSFEVVDDETGEPLRVERRRLRRGRRAYSMVGGFFRSVFIIAAAAGLMATIFTWWTPPGFLPSSVRQDLAQGAPLVPTGTPPASPMPTPNWAVRVGIVSGHRGPQNDPGATCPDGLTERDLVFNVAQGVVAGLQNLGYTVDLLDEFDPRLQNYQAAALLSIHANTCREWPNGEIVSGYLIAGPAARVTARGNDELLVDCVSRSYANTTGLMRREGTTIDMTDYHNFREIHPLTPGAIIELGFMRADREILVQPERLSGALTQGLLCFLEPLRFQPTATPGGAPVPTTQG